jgi:hypothetical protein
MMPSATVKGPFVEPVITDTLRPMMPASPTPRSNFCGKFMVDASLQPNEKE